MRRGMMREWQVSAALAGAVPVPVCLYLYSSAGSWSLYNSDVLYIIHTLLLPDFSNIVLRVLLRFRPVTDDSGNIAHRQLV